ncbi:MAG: hypothetical protein ACLFS2_03180 [Halochromatium sp.]
MRRGQADRVEAHLTVGSDGAHPEAATVIENQHRRRPAPPARGNARAPRRASAGAVTGDATQKASENTSKALWPLDLIAGQH